MQAYYKNTNEIDYTFYDDEDEPYQVTLEVKYTTSYPRGVFEFDNITRKDTGKQCWNDLTDYDLEKIYERLQDFE